MCFGIAFPYGSDGMDLCRTPPEHSINYTKYYYYHYSAKSVRRESVNVQNNNVRIGWPASSRVD